MPGPWCLEVLFRGIATIVSRNAYNERGHVTGRNCSRYRDFEDIGDPLVRQQCRFICFITGSVATIRWTNASRCINDACNVANLKRDRCKNVENGLRSTDAFQRRNIAKRSFDQREREQERSVTKEPVLMSSLYIVNSRDDDRDPV